MADACRPVLVADDQPDVIAALRLLLRSAGFDMHGASSVDEVRARLADGEYDAVLMDLNYARDTTSGAEGLQLIADLHAARPDVPLIAMTGWANIDTAVQAMRLGARGYVPKPWSNDALVQVLRDEIAQARADRRAGTLAAREWREAESAAARAAAVRAARRARVQPRGALGTGVRVRRRLLRRLRARPRPRSRSASATSAARASRRAARLERPGHGARLRRAGYRAT